MAKLGGMDAFVFHKTDRPPIRATGHALERYAMRVHPGTRSWLWMNEFVHRLAHEGQVIYGPPDWCHADNRNRWYVLLDENTLVPLDIDPNNPEGYVAATVLLRRNPHNR